MFEFSDVAVAHAIQLAVAPVFLLTGIAAILSVMTNRLGRIIDRARVLEEKLDRAAAEAVASLHADLGHALAPRKADQLCDHAVHDYGATRLHGYCPFVPERIPAV